MVISTYPGSPFGGRWSRREPNCTGRPRTEKGRRSVALDPATVAALRDHRRRQAAEQLALGPAYVDAGLVSAAEDGSPLPPERFSDRFEAIATVTKSPRIRFHDLRHTYATLASRLVCTRRSCRSVSGHADIALMLNVYSPRDPRAAGGRRQRWT
jgi:integrase